MNKKEHVYLVEMDNCESYEDYRSWISKVFTTYKKASQWLIDEGFEPYCESFWGEKDIRFYWEESDEYMANCRDARIIEMELEDNG